MPKMSMFTLAISCVITSNLPWFINLTVQVPVQYCSYKIGFYFHHQSRPQLGVGFGLAVSSFFLELCLHWSPVAYWAPTDVGSSSFSVLSFAVHTVHGVLRQEYWSGLPFPSPVDHVLSELSTMTRTSWMALHGLTHSFIELDKAVVHVISLVSFLWLWFSFCLPSGGKE